MGTMREEQGEQYMKRRHQQACTSQRDYKRKNKMCRIIIGCPGKSIGEKSVVKALLYSDDNEKERPRSKESRIKDDDDDGKVNQIY